MVTSACNGISISVKVGGDEPVSESTGLMNTHPLEIGSNEQVVVTISYAKDSSRADAPFSVEFGDVTLTYSTINNYVPPKTCEPVTVATQGPITAMDYLATATSGWTKANTQTISACTTPEGGSYTMSKEYTVNARLPYYSEINGKTATYLLEYLDGGSWYYESPQPTNYVSGLYGYWLLSTDSGMLNGASTYYGGYGTNSVQVDNASMNGVRPVINISTGDIG